MALVDQLTEHRRYLASVLERQECRRRVVNAGRYAAQPALGVQPAGPARHGHGSTAAPLEATAQAGPSREGGVLSPNRTGRPSPPPSPSKRNVANYIAAEEAVRNDYAAWYGVSGDWPSNYVLGAGSDEICEEYVLREASDVQVSHTPAADGTQAKRGRRFRTRPTRPPSASTVAVSPAAITVATSFRCNSYPSRTVEGHCRTTYPQAVG